MMAGKAGKMKKILAVALMGMLFTASFVFAAETAKTEAAPTATAAATTKDACEPGKIPAKKAKKHKKHKKAAKKAEETAAPAAAEKAPAK